MSQEPRNLTDADVEAIVNLAIMKFYNEVGKGFMGLVWKGALAVLLLLAAYGMLKGR